MNIKIPQNHFSGISFIIFIFVNYYSSIIKLFHRRGHVSTGVCLFIGRITQKLLDGFPWNLDGGPVSVQIRPHWLLLQIWISDGSGEYWWKKDSARVCMDLDTELILDEACLTIRGLLAEVYALLISKNGFVDRAGLTIYLCVQQKKKTTFQKRSRNSRRLRNFSFLKCSPHPPTCRGSIFRSTAFTEQQNKVAMSHEQAGVIRLEQLHSWELSWGSHAVTPHPSVHFHPDNGRRRGALQKRPRGEKGGSRLAGGRSCDPARPTAARRPHRSAGVEVEVMWLRGNLQAQTQYARLARTHTWEHRNVQNVPFRRL